METIDILLASYNGGAYIGEQISSVQNQTHQAWRLLIRDDGSNDDTLEIVQEFAERDTRIKIISDAKGSLGASGNFKELMQFSEANYIAFCDQDDVWLPSKLEKSYAKLLTVNPSNNSPALVHCDSVLVDENLNLIKSEFIGRRGNIAGVNGVVFASPVQGAAALINKALKIKYLEFDTKLSHDHHAVLIAEFMGVRAYIAEPLMLYRQHSKNLVGAGVLPKSEGSIISKLTRLFQSRHTPVTFKLSLAAIHPTIKLATHFNSELLPKAKKSVDELIYLMEGKRLYKKLLILIKNRYGFYKRRDIFCLLIHTLKNKA